MSALRDVLLIARFELLRALRTWRALAQVVLVLVAASGAAWLFVEVVGVMESELAHTMGVASTDTPGAMLDTLVHSKMYRGVISAMVGSESRVDAVLAIPPLAIFHLWFGLLLVPFFAASASAECLSIDLRSGALRYEALRTGRLELVLGRFVGQAVLTGVASAVAVLGVWAVGMTAMVGNDAGPLLAWLLALTLRAWVFGLPFVGLGVACSQLTSSPAWARVMALSAVAASWVGFGLARWAESTPYAVLSDIALQLLPQGWMGGLWEPGWWRSGLVCVCLSLCLVVLGYTRFAGRDL